MMLPCVKQVKDASFSSVIILVPWVGPVDSQATSALFSGLDIKGNTWSQGNIGGGIIEDGPRFSNSESKFHGSAGYLNGYSTYLTTPDTSTLRITSGDFSIEVWVWLRTATAFFPIVIQKDTSTTSNSSWGLIFDVSSGIRPLLQVGSGTGGTTQNLTSGSTIASQTWVFIQAGQDSGTLRIGVNGAQTNSATRTATGVDGGAPVYIGFGNGKNNSGYNSSQVFNGYMSQLRVTKGVWRGFYLPAQPFPQK
jgi:hypothetical protein